jgi:hypothetical protein
VETTSSTDGKKLDESCKGSSSASNGNAPAEIDLSVNKFYTQKDFAWVKNWHQKEIKALEK